jgi:hypothetical protein
MAKSMGGQSSRREVSVNGQSGPTAASKARRNARNSGRLETGALPVEFLRALARRVENAFHLCAPMRQAARRHWLATIQYSDRLEDSRKA